VRLLSGLPMISRAPEYSQQLRLLTERRSSIVRELLQLREIRHAVVHSGGAISVTTSISFQVLVAKACQVGQRSLKSSGRKASQFSPGFAPVERPGDDLAEKQSFTVACGELAR
jgi:hypothetical protein